MLEGMIEVARGAEGSEQRSKENFRDSGCVDRSPSKSGGIKCNRSVASASGHRHWLMFRKRLGRHLCDAPNKAPASCK